MSKKQEFYQNDMGEAEVESGVFMRVIVLEVIPITDKRAFGEYRYVVAPVAGRGRMTVVKLSKIKK